jgi:RNA polymerase sigma-70 factor (ECF subfamily)
VGSRVLLCVVARLPNSEFTAASDRELVEHWRRGDPRAPNVLIARHRASIRAYFSRRVKGPDSEDLLQETLVRVTRSVHSFEYRSSFRVYLFCIAENTLKDYLRAAARRPLMTEELDEREDTQARAAEQILVEFDELYLFFACLDSLSPEARHLIYRFYVQRLNARVIAMQDRVPPGTIRRRLFDARMAMQRHREAFPDAEVGLAPNNDQVRAFFG